MASLTIRPGSQVRLKGQDDHVPDFLVIRCDRDRCWIRQQDWGPDAELNVRFTQLFIPDQPGQAIEGDMSPGSVPLNPVTCDRELTNPLSTESPSMGISSDHPVSPDAQPPNNVIYLDDYRRRRAH
jgi:hypothetical protein